MECKASMAEELAYIRVGSSAFADEGTAAHTLLADCLLQRMNAVYFLGRVIPVITLDEETGEELDRREFKVDEEMAGFVQVVLDSVNSRVEQGWTLLVEQRVDFSGFIGIPNQFGTADIILISPDGKHVSVEDLKYGRGHKVYPDNNHQMLCYAVGVLETFDGLMGDFETFDMRVHQPRLNFEGATERSYTRAEIIEFAAKMKAAAAENALYIARKIDGFPIDKNLLNYSPSYKTCLWCKHKPNCKAHEKMVLDEVMQDFVDLDKLPQAHEEIMLNGPKPPQPSRLGQAFANLDMIEEWCRSVRAECERQVFAGMEVMGVDGLPLKLIEGRKGDRKWRDETKAEAMLVGVLPPDKAYSPRKIISPSQAAKILDKKKTKAQWEQFETIISQAPGKPKVVEGSAQGTPWTGEVQDNEFVDLSTMEEA
jgi:Protein of unknown function (DUF2800).